MALPIQFTKKLETFLSPAQIKEVMCGFSSSPSLAFRINTLLAVRDEVSLKLFEQGFKLQPIDFIPNAYLLLNKTKEDLLATECYKDGQIYIQSVSSMLPAVVLNPKPNEKILDLTAAPGSKTTQIAALMQNTGELSANDKSRDRIYKLRDVLRRQGVLNTKVISASGEYLWKKLPEYFDRVLLDAPCSMEGRFNALESKTFADWSPKKVKLLSKIQKYLLRSAISCVKVGGIVVYSTCTLSPEENEEVIDWVLGKENGKVELEQIELKLKATMPGLTSWKSKIFAPSLNKTMRILPSEMTEGFYIAKIRKIDSNLSHIN